MKRRNEKTIDRLHNRAHNIVDKLSYNDSARRPDNVQTAGEKEFWRLNRRYWQGQSGRPTPRSLLSAVRRMYRLALSF